MYTCGERRVCAARGGLCVTTRDDNCVSGALRLRRALATRPRTHACVRATQQRRSDCAQYWEICRCSVSLQLRRPQVYTAVEINLTLRRCLCQRSQATVWQAKWAWSSKKALERHTRKIKSSVGLLFLVKLSPDPIVRPYLALERAQANCARVSQANYLCSRFSPGA